MKSGVVLAEHVLLFIDVIKEVPEQGGGNVTDDGWGTKDPGEVWIMDQSGEGKSECVSDTLGQKIQSRNQATHVDWSAGVRDTVGGDVDEEFGEAADGIWDGNPPDGDWGEKTHSITADTGYGATIISAGTGLVGVVVKDRITGATDSGQKEPGGDTRNRAISDVPFAERGVEGVVQDWSRDNDYDRVEVLEEVVGNAVTCQHSVDTVSCGSEAIVVDRLNREEAEHSTGLECSTNILNEVVVPRDDNIASAGCDDTGFCRIPKPVTTNFFPSFLQAHADNFAAPAKVASSGRMNHESRLDPEKYCWKKDPNSQWQSKCKGPADVLLRIGCWNTHERPDIDETIEP